MLYINKTINLFLLIGIFVSQAGCSKEYQVWLYNLSGSTIVVANSEFRKTVEAGKAFFLYDHKNEENVLLPVVLKIELGGQEQCYPLGRITKGGYGQYDKSNDLLVRFKLDKDNKIYVYNVSKGIFNPNGPSGVQPKGYPVQSKICK